MIGANNGRSKRICYNCGNDTADGNFLPDPSSEDKEKLIWCCDICYEDWYIK